MFKYDTTKKTVKELSDIYREGKLIIDNTYQRRSVWSEADKVRLIETMLLELLIPELFFWKAKIDPETGESITHIVDGQQRINAVVSFIENRFKLSCKHLTNQEIKEKYGDLYFRDFEDADKSNIWDYSFRIINIDKSSEKQEIIEVFNRLNLTDYNLNSQEKRNTKSGIFSTLVNSLSNHYIWDKYNLFKASDIRRMKDVEFCASLVLLYRNGIIEQADQQALNQAYDAFKTEYNDVDSDKSDIEEIIEVLNSILEKIEIKSFLQKRIQLYSLFSVLFSFKREHKEIDDNNIKNLLLFVELYSKFDNTQEVENQLTASEREFYDKLKRYKLASSEGVNKYTNRMIRFNILKEFMLLDESKSIIASELFSKL